MPEKLTIVIDAKDQASGVIRGLAGVTKSEFAGMTGAVKAHANELRAAGVAMTAFGAGVVAVAAKCVGALRTQEVAEAKLTAAIAGTNQAIDKGRLMKLASDLQKTTTFGDEANIEMMALLTTFGLTQDQIEQLSPRVQNISAMMGTDLASSAVAVGKAIQLGSAAALRRYGIVIDDATMASGNFNDILQAIDRNTGPAAEGMTKGSGAAEQLKNTLGDASQSIGKALVPSIQLATRVLTPMVESFGKLAETPAGRTLVVIGTAAGAALMPLGGLVMLLPTLARSWEILTAAQVRNAAAANTAVAANVRAGAASSIGIRGVIGRAGALGGPWGLAGAAVVMGGVQGIAAASQPGRPGQRIGRGLEAATQYGAAGMLWGGAKRLFGDSAPAGAESSDDMAAWRGQMNAKWGAGELAAAPAALPIAEMPAMEELLPAAEIAAPATGRQPTFGMTRVGKDAWLLPSAGPYEPGGASVRSIRTVGPNRFEIIVEVEPNIPAGVYDQHTSEWMEDLQYAAGSP